MNKKLRTSLIVALCVVLIAGLAGYGYYSYLKGRVQTGLQENKVEALPTPMGPQMAENILLIGSDDRGNEEGARSDTMMIIHVNEDRSRISGVSVPRDLMIEDMPDCPIWDPLTREQTGETHAFGAYTMSNSAFATGGPRCAVIAAEHISGLHMTRYVEVDFKGFETLVDTVGGVEINICKPMVDGNLGVLFETPGVHNVDGGKALDFARARQVKGDSGSDLSRMDRQQYLLKQIYKQKINSSLLFNPEKVNKLIDAFTENTRTDNVDAEFLQSLAFGIRENGSDSIEMTTIPAEEWVRDENRLKDDPEATRQLFTDIVLGTPKKETTDVTTAPAQTAPDPTSDPTITEAPVSPPVTDTPPEPVTDIPCGWD